MRTLFLAILALTLGTIACDDANESAPEPTPTTLTAEAPGAEGFRSFAAQIEAALDAGDMEFFLDRAEAELVTCTAENMIGLGGPICDFEGQTYTGFPMGRWRSEGNILPVEDVADFGISLRESALLEASDDFGDGALRIYALSVDGTAATAIITALVERPVNFAGEGPLRVVRVTSWTFDGDQWRFTFLLTAAVLAEEFLAPCPPALDYVIGTWERYPDPALPSVGESVCPF